MKASRPNCEGQWLDVPYLDSLHIAVHCSVADKNASEEGEGGNRPYRIVIYLRKSEF